MKFKIDWGCVFAISIIVSIMSVIPIMGGIIISIDLISLVGVVIFIVFSCLAFLGVTFMDMIE